MNKQEALKIVSEVCANYRGTLQEHTQIQSALHVIRENINGTSKEKENEDGIVS